MSDFGHWQCKTEFVADAYGFIYEITNVHTNKKYIGKKQMQTVYKRPPLKGKKNKRHEIKETDWRQYMGSSRELLEDIEKLGKQSFTFDIIKFCSSKWELAYFETKEQFDRNVLLSSDYYNGIINCRIGKQPKGSKL